MKRIQVKDVAALAGVSPATVSRVINKHPHISPETRAKVLAAIEQLGYEPSRVAQRLRMGMTRIFGLILSDVTNPFFTAAVRGIEDVAYAREYSVLLCNADEQPEREALYTRVLLAEKVAGVIISPTDERCTTCAAFLERGIPVVAMDRRIRGLAIDTVVVDNIEGAYQAVSHLIRLGHRRIGLIGGRLEISTGRERQEGYLKALRDHGIPVDPELIRVGDFKQESGYRLACELLSLPDRPTAIFAANNLMTLGALNAIHKKGLAIPRDVAIVGFDDMPWAASLNPALTAVAQPAYELGRTAAELLLARIADPNRPAQEVILHTQLIIRQSCGSSP